MLNEKFEKTVDSSGGANQSRVRDYNERLVLTLLRRHGSLAKSEIARRSGLSAQTASVIMRSLEQDELLLKGEPVRGKVGQPSVPMRLNPEGVFSVGLKIGRRSADLVLVDFLGNQRMATTSTFSYPTPTNLLKFAKEGIANFLETLSAKERKRVVGVGVSMPFELWNWAEKVGAPQSEMSVWKDFDFKSELGAITNLPISVQNDATSACGAELLFGRGTELTDFVYFFIGTFIGGGVVLNNSVYSGRSGNAGAFGPMPAIGEDGTTTTLIDHASVFTLESKLKEVGIDLSPLWREPEDWQALGPVLDDWIKNTARHLAVAIVASCSVIDFEAAIIDGAFPEAVKAKIVAEIQKQIKNLDTRGIRDPLVLEGLVGQSARALGGASLPLFSRYLLDQSVLFQEV